MVTIAEDYGVCSLCRKGKFAKKEEKEIGGTTYILLRCKNCSHQVARSVK